MTTAFTAAARNRLGWLFAGATVGVMAAVVLAPNFGPTSGRAADPTASTAVAAGAAEHTISVTGTGRVLVKPDVADISLGVSVQRAKAKDSEQVAAAQMAAVVAALKAAGVGDTDIQTANVSLQPIYDYSTSKAVITGYETDNIVAITIRDISKVGDTIDAAVAAGATSVNGITFRVDNPTTVEAQARQAAMLDAKSKATTLAAAAGVTITGVASISEVSATAPQPIYYDRAAAASAPSMAAPVTTPVQPGNVETDITVTVVYLI
jgi:uncharacterized protein